MKQGRTWAHRWIEESDGLRYAGIMAFTSEEWARRQPSDARPISNQWGTGPMYRMGGDIYRRLSLKDQTMIGPGRDTYRDWMFHAGDSCARCQTGTLERRRGTDRWYLICDRMDCGESHPLPR
jgi:hypothetical protein